MFFVQFKKIFNGSPTGELKYYLVAGDNEKHALYNAYERLKSDVGEPTADCYYKTVELQEIDPNQGGPYHFSCYSSPYYHWNLEKFSQEYRSEFHAG